MKSLIERHKALNKEIDDLVEQRKYVRQQIAEANCPFKVGDTLVSTEKGGFKVGEKVIVASISYRWGDSDYRLKVFKIKENGKPSKNSTEVWSPDKMEKAE